MGSAAGSGGASKKRVWKRWGALEEAALQSAVEKHGTKDWTAIVQVCIRVCVYTTGKLYYIVLSV